MNLDLSGRTALVCGASQGIGAAVAKELSELGARVVLLARSEERLAATMATLKPVKEPHLTVACDIADLNKLETSVDDILKTIGGAVILVNNTGGPSGGPITEAPDEQFLETFQKHVLAASHLTKLVLPYMKKRGFGRIINIVSTSVKVPIPGLGVSNTIRAAIGGWSKTLAGEVACYGITVNCVLPGMTKTERLEAIIEGNVKKTTQTREQVEEKMLASIPAGRFGEAHEIASAAAFLATPAAGYINGVALAVDGGRTGCY